MIQPNEEDFVATFLAEASEFLELWEQSCMALEKQHSEEHLNALFRAAHNFKGSAKSVGLDMLCPFVHQAEDLITQLKSGRIPANRGVITTLLDCQALLGEWVNELGSNREYVADTSELSAILASLVGHLIPSSDANIADLSFGFFDDPVLNDASDVPLGVGTGVAINAKLEAHVSPLNKKDKQESKIKLDETLRISTRKLDSLIRLIGELSVQHAIIRNSKENAQLNSDRSHDAIDLAHKVIQDLQSEAMSIRMQPLTSLFQRMERVARDVARQQSKLLNVVLKGSEVELDRTVIERIKDPLVHILRNAVDHGVEKAEVRQKKSKAPTATITLEATQTASSVSIVISDDGQGLNREKILNKALAQGLVASDVKFSDKQIDQMIFLPGLSTADTVTDISGRGVGMDVVKKSVDELGGTLHIESTPGNGTSFNISLPSTLSIIDAVIISLDEALYAVPIQDIQEVVDVSNYHLETMTQHGQAINFRGNVLPIEDLSSYLLIPKERIRPKHGVALVATHQAALVAFKVDRVVGQESIVVRKLEGKLADVAGFSGGTILANGEPSMIIHLPRIVKSYLETIKH